MGIDYIIDYACEPKRALTVPGIMGRLKGRDRAEAVIQLYREQGDMRPPSQIGFEMVRRDAEGTEETEIIVVQNLLDAAEDLVPYEQYCTGCPANRIGAPFGCIGAINYPLSEQGERWLLDQLPSNEHPLPYMLLQRAIHELGYSGRDANPLRVEPGVYLEASAPLERDLEAVHVNGDQVFELLFLSGPIHPAHGSMLMQFFGAISQDLDAGVIMQLADPPSEAWIDHAIPFLLTTEPDEDPTIRALKQFFRALHIAFKLRVAVLLDV